MLLVLALFNCKEDTQPPTLNLLYSFDDIELDLIETRTTQKNWQSTGWGIYEDIIFPGTGILWQVSHETFDNEEVLACDIVGGDAYNNVFFTNTLAAQWEGLEWYFKKASYFEYELMFFPAHRIACDHPDLSEIEGLEFTFQHVVIPDSWGWGVQWSKTNTWSYWDDQPDNGKPKGWVNIDGIQSCIEWNQWNSLKIIGSQTKNTLIYEQLIVNGASINMNKEISKVNVSEEWAENFVQIGFQINGNKAIRTDHDHGVDPVRIYLKNVSLNVYGN
jgi:hypothetical protein